MKELCERYLRDLEEYNRLENVSYINKSDDEIIAELKKITGQKREISARQKEIIGLILKPFEDNTITKEEEETLRSFCKELCSYRKASDAGLALLIHEKLLHQAEKENDLDSIIRESYECGMCEWNLSYDNTLAKSAIHRFSDIQMYLLDYGKMGETGRQYMIRCLNNQMLEVGRFSAETILKTADKLFDAYAWIERNYGSSALLDQAYLSTARNVMVAVRSFRNGLSGTEYEIQNVLRYARIARERTGRISKEKLDDFDQWETWWFVQFHCGLIDLDSLLNWLEEKEKPKEGDSFNI